MAKIDIDIEYCVPCGYQNLAAWTVSEMFAAAGTDAAIGLTPGDAGVYKITVDGETWFDKHNVKTRATKQNPKVYPEGIPYVIVNGEVVIDEGEHSGACPGRGIG